MPVDSPRTTRFEVTAILTTAALIAAILLPALKEAPGRFTTDDTIKHAQHQPRR